MSCQLSVGFPIKQAGTGSHSSLPKGRDLARGTHSSSRFVRCDRARNFNLHPLELKRVSQGERDDLFYPRTRETTQLFSTWGQKTVHKMPDQKKKKIQLKNLTQQIRETSGIPCEFQDWPRLAELYLIIEKPRQDCFCCSPALLSPPTVSGLQGEARGLLSTASHRSPESPSTEPPARAWTYGRCPEEASLLLSTTTHTIHLTAIWEMQFCLMVLMSPHQHPRYRNCCCFAPAPVHSGWSLQAAAVDANKAATVTISTISPWVSPSSFWLALQILQPFGLDHLHPLSQ